MKLSFSIAKRFLLYSKGQSILIMLGIAIGVAVQIFIGLLISGLQDDLINTTVGSSPHISIKAKEDDGLFVYDDTLKSEINSIEEATAIGVFADSPAFVVKDDLNSSVLIRGVALEGTSIYSVNDRLVAGKEAANANEVTIGIGLADKFDYKVNDPIAIQSVNGTISEGIIVGIFDLKVASLNSSWIFTPLENAQTIFDYKNTISSVEIQISDVFEADRIAEELSLNEDVMVENWKAKNEDLLSGLNGQSVSSIMIQIFVLIAVVLGIASVLAITVLQKSRQIGILKAMGIQDNQASLIFLFQGLLLGLLGAIIGVILGVVLLVLFTTFATNADGSALIPIEFDPYFIAFSASIAIVSALLASLIPARKSSKLSPIEVIRNG